MMLFDSAFLQCRQLPVARCVQLIMNPVLPRAAAWVGEPTPRQARRLLGGRHQCGPLLHLLVERLGSSAGARSVLGWCRGVHGVCRRTGGAR